MNYKPLLVQEAIGATKRVGIVLGVVLALLVSISTFHVLRDLQGLHYAGGPLYDSYPAFYAGTLKFIIGTFSIMGICFCIHNALLGDHPKVALWLVVLLMAMYMF